jgi:membrane-associated protease RseP (regulator of RpoE activity)
MRREQEPSRSVERPAPSHRRRDEPSPSYETGGLRLALLVGAVVLVGVRFGWPLVVMILGVVVTIFFHELGHYLTARWAGMKCTEFFIGFGPKIWSFRRGECEYGFKVIPAGAYVRIIGMNNLDEVDPADAPRTYREQSFPKRLLVVSAGSLSHLVQAFVIGVLLFGVVGMPGGSLTDPEVDGWEVGAVVDDSAAAAAGLQDGDVIVAVDGRPASDFDGLSEGLASYDVGDDVSLTVERDGSTDTAVATLRPRPASQPGGEVGAPFLGVGSYNVMSAESVGVGTAIAETPGQMWDVTTASLSALGHAFSPTGLTEFADNFAPSDGDGGSTSTSGGSEAQSSATGGRSGGLMSIIGFVHVGTADVEYRLAFMLALFFQINLLLAVVNMLPLPPLDGGHAAMAIYERVRSRGGRRYHADFAKLLPLTYAVFLVLVVIGVSTMYLDIVNPIEL